MWQNKSMGYFGAPMGYVGPVLATEGAAIGHGGEFDQASATRLQADLYDEVIQSGLLFPEQGSLRVLLQAPDSSPHDMRQHPIRLRCRSSGYLWQGAREPVHGRVVLPAAIAGVRCR